MTNYTELKKLAEAATPGPWREQVWCGLHGWPDDWCATFIPHGPPRKYSKNGEKKAENDAKFIAAANPSVILEMIAQLEAANAVIEKIKKYGPEEPDEKFVCVYCDLGYAGYSSKGVGFHDDDCLLLEARNYQAKYGVGEK